MNKQLAVENQVLDQQRRQKELRDKFEQRYESKDQFIDYSKRNTYLF